MNLSSPVLLAAALLAASPVSAELSTSEAAIAAAVDENRGDVEAFLEDIVNVNSGTLNLQGVTRLGEMVRGELEPLGFDVEWIDMSETGRAGHLVATHIGNGQGQRVLMIGHLDTVFEPSSAFQAYSVDPQQPGRAVGPGVGDDKGGIAVILATLQAMHAAGTLDAADIKVVLTGDEERPGTPLELARRDLIAAGEWADVALGFEGLSREDGKDFGTTARRSSTSWTIRASGKTGHSSGIFSESAGYGAIYELARILDAFRRDLPEENLTYNVGVMAGGTPAEIDAQGFAVNASGKTNIIAETAIARGDLRTLTQEQDARIRQRMQAIVADHLPGTDAEMEFSEDGYPPMAPTSANRALLERLNSVNRDLGLAEMGEWDPARRGAADISFVAEDVDAALAGLATSGGRSHADGEYIDLDSIPKQAKRVAVLMSRLSQEPRD